MKLINHTFSIPLYGKRINGREDARTGQNPSSPAAHSQWIFIASRQPKFASLLPPRGSAALNHSTLEHIRLEEARKGVPWRLWGPYLSERQWGTVREDYSDSGSAWDYFTHDQARSRAYLWGEDGIAGFSDDKQRLCFALAFWNGADPILKERLFGLTNSEGNHGEDVKEYYYYLDSTPTHSYMRFLYKYPHQAYPYSDLVRTSRSRSRFEPEYELIDTGVFDNNRYFDIFVEYAKATPHDTAIRVTVANRGVQPADIHLLPTLWFRNTWTNESGVIRPSILGGQSANSHFIDATHPELGTYRLHCDAADKILFTENETNTERVFGTPNTSLYVKDGIANYVVHGIRSGVNPALSGTKAAAHYRLTVPSQSSVTVDLRLSKLETTEASPVPTAAVLALREQEAGHFYNAVIPAGTTGDDRLIMRQALAGMLWSKQYYYFDVDQWLQEHGEYKSFENLPLRPDKSIS